MNTCSNRNVEANEEENSSAKKRKNRISRPSIFGVTFEAASFPCETNATNAITSPDLPFHEHKRTPLVFEEKWKIMLNSTFLRCFRSRWAACCHSGCYWDRLRNGILHFAWLILSHFRASYLELFIRKSRDCHGMYIDNSASGFLSRVFVEIFTALLEADLSRSYTSFAHLFILFSLRDKLYARL